MVSSMARGIYGPRPGLGSKRRCAREAITLLCFSSGVGAGKRDGNTAEFWGEPRSGKGVGRPSWCSPPSGTWEGRPRNAQGPVQGHTKKCLPLPVLGAGQSPGDRHADSLTLTQLCATGGGGQTNSPSHPGLLPVPLACPERGSGTDRKWKGQGFIVPVSLLFTTLYILTSYVNVC